MCAQYDIKTPPEEIARALHRNFTTKAPIEWKARMLPYSLAPVAVADKLELMQYSLVPYWSKEPKVKFATYNARLDTILEKATWKNPFVKKHCLVPLTRFVEPIYEGELAGNMVGFEPKEEPLLFAAGIWDEWKDKATGRVIHSFAIVTDEPSDFVKTAGHDRQPVFLSQERGEEWLRNEGEKGEELRTFLREVAEEPNLKTVIDRPMVAKKK